MKRKAIGYGTLALSLAALLAGCGSETASTSAQNHSDTPWEGGSGASSSSQSISSSSEASKEVVGITIATLPSKTAYVEGERFDPNGMLIDANYDDGTTDFVFDYSYDITRALRPTDTAITVTYKTFTAQVAITVQALQKFEAENYSSQCGTLAVRAEAAAVGTYSGIGYLGGWDAIAGKWVEFNIDSDKDATAEFYCCLDVPEAGPRPWNGRFTLYLNDEVWPVSDDAIYAVDNPAWFQWLDVDLGTMNLKQGTNTIRIVEINAITNMDYIGFITDASLTMHV